MVRCSTTAQCGLIPLRVKAFFPFFQIVDDEVRAPHIKQAVRDRLVEHKEYIGRHCGDMPAIRDCR